jgi:hypothetical protein
LAKKKPIIVPELLSQAEIQESSQLAASFVVNHGDEPSGDVGLWHLSDVAGLPVDARS